MPKATCTPCASSASTSAWAAVRRDVWDAAIPATLLPEREDVRGHVVRVGAADQAGGHRAAAVLDLIEDRLRVERRRELGEVGRGGQRRRGARLRRMAARAVLLPQPALGGAGAAFGNP